MGLLQRLIGKRERLPNITAYALSAIVDGNVRAAPLGTVPRFPDAFEKDLRARHRPADSSYVNETLHGVAVTLLWQDGGVAAISFLSPAEAAAYPGFRPIPADDLASLDGVLRHFPR